MKKFVFVGLVVALVLTLSAGAVGAAPLAATGDRDGVRAFSGPGLGQGRGPAYGFVDENKDGVNDRFVDANGDGECDLVGEAQGRGYGRSMMAGRGSQAGAEGQQRGKGTGAMARFVDADGNGICDYVEQN